MTARIRRQWQQLEDLQLYYRLEQQHLPLFGREVIDWEVAAPAQLLVELRGQPQ